MLETKFPGLITVVLFSASALIAILQEQKPFFPII